VQGLLSATLQLVGRATSILPHTGISVWVPAQGRRRQRICGELLKRVAVVEAVTTKRRRPAKQDPATGASLANLCRRCLIWMGNAVGSAAFAGTTMAFSGALRSQLSCWFEAASPCGGSRRGSFDDTARVMTRPRARAAAAAGVWTTRSWRPGS